MPSVRAVVSKVSDAVSYCSAGNELKPVQF
uniref:Uncharacterized protein n=1 Tax=Arundo donax TaxID=35708 RepID=A0A0A8XWK9_ARUDO